MSFLRKSFLPVGAFAGLVLAGCLSSNEAKVFLSVVTAPLVAWSLFRILGRSGSPNRPASGNSFKQLAWIRVLVCSIALILTAVEDLPATAGIPGEFLGNFQFFDLLNKVPGYLGLLSNPYLLAMLQWSTAILLLMALVGWNTRATLLLGGLGFFLIQTLLRQYTYFFHTGMVPLYLLWILPWTPCAATWSVDSWTRPDGAKRDPTRASLGVRACEMVLVAVYLMCGLSKLGNAGVGWLDPDNLRHKLVQDAMNPIFLDQTWKPTLWLVQEGAPGFLFTLLGIASLAAELGYMAVLFSRPARIILPAVMACIHLGILFLQHILFLDLILLQLVFLDADRVAERLGRLRRSAGAKGKTISRPLEGKESPRPSTGFQTTVSVAFTVQWLLWILRVESYPATSWQMYAHREAKQPVIFYRIVAHLENGSTEVVPLNDYCPAVMPNIRFILPKAFRADSRAAFDSFLFSQITRYNRKQAFDLRVRDLEVQQWTWDYTIPPHNPASATIVNRHVFDLGAFQVRRIQSSFSDPVRPDNR